MFDQYDEYEAERQDLTNLPQHQAELCRVFGFAWQDLTMNRVGEISEEQREFIDQINTRLYNPRVLVIGMALAVLGLAVSIVGYVRSVDGIGPLLLGLLLSVLPFTLFLITVQAIRVNARMLREGEVSFSEGEVRVSTLRLRGDPTYMIIIGRRRFIVRSAEQQEIFSPDRVYRAYYVFNWPVHILLSVEPLS
jgi:hypothetical protein